MYENINKCTIYMKSLEVVSLIDDVTDNTKQNQFKKKKAEAIGSI